MNLVRLIQAWYRKVYEERTEYLNRYWNEICNSLLTEEKKRKLNVMKSAPKITKRNSLIIQDNQNTVTPIADQQQKTYNIQIRISTINNEQRKLSIKFFRKSIIERRVLIQRIKLGLIQLNNDFIDQVNIQNSQQSSQLSPLSPLENLNSSQNEFNFSITNINQKLKKNLSIMPSPPSSPQKAGIQLQKIIALKVPVQKKKVKSKRNKSPSQKNQCSVSSADCIFDELFISCKLSVDKFENHSINPYFMMDLSLQDKGRFQFYPTQPVTFLDTIKDSLILKSNKDKFLIKEDDERQLKYQNSKILQAQQSNRLILHKSKLTPFPMLQIRKPNSLEIKVLSFKQIIESELILFKKLILDATEQCKDYKGWKS